MASKAAHIVGRLKSASRDDEILQAIAELYQSYRDDPSREARLAKARAACDEGAVGVLSRHIQNATSDAVLADSCRALGQMQFMNPYVARRVGEDKVLLDQLKIVLSSRNTSERATKEALYVLSILSANHWGSHPVLLAFVAHGLRILNCPTYNKDNRAEGVRFVTSLCHNEKNRHALVQAGVVQAMLRVMVAGDLQMRYPTAAVAISQLTGDGDGDPTRGVDEDKLELLISIVLDVIKSSLQRNPFPLGSTLYYTPWKVVLGLRNVARVDRYRDMVGHAGGIVVVSRCIWNGMYESDEQLASVSLETLWFLAFSPHNQRRIMDDKRLMDLLEALRTSPIPSSRTTASGILSLCDSIQTDPSNPGRARLVSMAINGSHSNKSREKSLVVFCHTKSDEASMTRLWLRLCTAGIRSECLSMSDVMIETILPLLEEAALVVVGLSVQSAGSPATRCLLYEAERRQTKVMAVRLAPVVIPPWAAVAWETGKINCYSISKDDTGHVADICAATVLAALHAAGVVAQATAPHPSPKNDKAKSLEALSLGEVMRFVVQMGHDAAAQALVKRKHDGKSLAWIRDHAGLDHVEKEFGLSGGDACRFLYDLKHMGA